MFHYFPSTRSLKFFSKTLVLQSPSQSCFSGEHCLRKYYLFFVCILVLNGMVSYLSDPIFRPQGQLFQIRVGRSGLLFSQKFLNRDQTLHSYNTHISNSHCPFSHNLLLKSYLLLVTIICKGDEIFFCILKSCISLSSILKPEENCANNKTKDQFHS